MVKSISSYMGFRFVLIDFLRRVAMFAAIHAVRFVVDSVISLYF